MKYVTKTSTYLYFFLFILSSPYLISSPKTYAKSMIETCQNSSNSCPSLLSYRFPWASKLSDVAYLFQVNISDILASNNNDSTTPWSSNQILPCKSLIKVPILCPCVDGLRRSVSTVYTVHSTDTWDSVSQSYGGLVSGEKLMSVNGGGRIGERMVVPLPCSCFDNRDGGGGVAVYMSYVVDRGEDLESIGAAYRTTVHELEEVNGLVSQSEVAPGDILAIPISACSSANLRWYNESLIVPNGSYALTANNCIKCSCLQTDLRLQCSPSGIMDSCSHLQCKGSNLFTGDTLQNQTPFGCNVTSCVYRGHFKHKIYNSLVNSSYIHCSGNKSHAIASPSPSPTSFDHSALPFFMLPPTASSPSPVSDPPMVIDTSEATSTHSKISSWKRRLLNHASCFGLLLLEIASPLIF